MTTKADAKTVTTTHDLLESFARSMVKAHFPETDSYGNPNLIRFFFDNGRLPRSTDHIKPWLYRGWLVPYLQLSENHPRVAKRYDYVCRTLDAGKLLDEPLPHIEFYGEFEREVKAGIKMLKDLISFVERSSGKWNETRDFCEWLAFALGVTNEPSKLKTDVQDYLYRNFSLEPLLIYPSDYLGQLLCESRHGKHTGFYPTPVTVVKLMAGIINASGTDIDRRGEKTVDPCVGTGRMLLISSNYSMRLYGQDIDSLCCLITKINLALYAPWYHIPESFFGDDEKNDEKTNDQSEENEIAPVVQTTPPETAETPQAAEKPEIEAVAPQTPVGLSGTGNDFERLRLEKQRFDKNKSKNKQKFTTEIEQPFLWDFGKK